MVWTRLVEIWWWKMVIQKFDFALLMEILVKGSVILSYCGFTMHLCSSISVVTCSWNFTILLWISCYSCNFVLDGVGTFDMLLVTCIQLHELWHSISQLIGAFQSFSPLCVVYCSIHTTQQTSVAGLYWPSHIDFKGLFFKHMPMMMSVPDHGSLGLMLTMLMIGSFAAPRGPQVSPSLSNFRKLDIIIQN